MTSASRRVLVAGATSAIAEETARLFAAEGAALFLAGRNEARLAAVADDLRARGAASVGTFALDFNDVACHAALLDAAEGAMGGLDVVLVAHGTLSDQKACAASPEETLRELATNFTSAAALLTLVANRFEARKAGVIAVISSVAGDRGRQSNYVYGSAKAGLSAFLSGLRNRLFKSGVAVVTIKPGFVDTPMTAHLPKNPLFASPGKVGRAIHAAIGARKDVVYVPGYWRLILAIIRAVPERLFKRLGL